MGKSEWDWRSLDESLGVEGDVFVEIQNNQ